MDFFRWRAIESRVGVLGAGVRHAALSRYRGPGWGSPGMCKTL